MLTTVTLDEHLIQEAYGYMPTHKQKDLNVNQMAELILREFVSSHKPKNKKVKKLSDLKGKIAFADNYDYKAMRRST